MCIDGLLKVCPISWAMRTRQLVQYFVCNNSWCWTLLINNLAFSWTTETADKVHNRETIVSYYRADVFVPPLNDGEKKLRAVAMKLPVANFDDISRHVQLTPASTSCHRLGEYTAQHNEPEDPPSTLYQQQPSKNRRTDRSLTGSDLAVKTILESQSSVTYSPIRFSTLTTLSAIT